MTVKKTADTVVGTRFVSNKGKVADIPMGVSIITTDVLVNGSVLLDGTPVTAPTSGKRNICKFAKCLVGTTTTSIKVATVGNQFKVGDQVMSKVGGKAYAITVIASASGVDTMTVGTAIDAPLSNGGFIYEAAAEAADTTSALKYSPVAITGTNIAVDVTSNLTVDAWAIAAVKRGEIGPVLLAALVANYAYISEI